MKLTERSSKLRFQPGVDSSSPMTSHVSLVSSASDLEIPSANANDVRQLPADIRLNMLTGVATSLSRSSSVPPPTPTIGDRPRDALSRINELIRQNSVQDIDRKSIDDEDEFPSSARRARRRSGDVSPIEYYINETNKLTSNLKNPRDSQQPRSNAQLEKANTSNVVVADDRLKVMPSSLLR